jgi:hypothetical protein
LVLAGSCLLVYAPVARSQAPVVSDRVAEVAARYQQPPDDARVLARWWWFGPALVKPELEREILAMRAGGFGGFEIQPVYPIALNDPQMGIENTPYLSPEFLGDISFAAERARENGLRVDLTLASGWPYGGPHVPITEAASRLRMATIDVSAGTSSAIMPYIGQGEKLLALFAGDGSAASFDPHGLKQLQMPANGPRMAVEASTSNRVIVAYIASRTLQQVKRPAVGAEGFVLDHLSRTAIEDHLRLVAEPLLKAFGNHPPYSVFSDSLEVYNTDWTDDFLAEFAKRRGYDLTPHLPQLYSGDDAEAKAVRHDWGLTQTELVNERYLTPINDWAIAHHTQFRSQTYGEPAVSMSSNRLVGLPEGEGPQWRSFSFTRWATSAGHLYGRPVISAETWTWLHSPAFRATPLDMKAEADRMFLEGVTQFVAHGWPYTPPQVPEPGYAFYAAAVFNDHTPWWPVMPEVTGYLQRVSYALRQGKPANDIAVLLPYDDAYTDFKPGKCSLSGEMAKYVTLALTQQILDSGYNLDYIDSEAIDAVGIPYPVLVLPHVTRLSPATLQKIAEYEKRGGKVIAVGSVPSLAPGLLHAETVTQEVQGLAKTVFAPGAGVLVAADVDLGAALQNALAQDVVFRDNQKDIQFLHRKLADGDLYFLANTSNHAVKTQAVFRDARSHAAWWDPFNGRISDAPLEPMLDLAPYESKVIVFTNGPASRAPAMDAAAAPGKVIADLGKDWKVTFRNQPAEEYATLHSWTEEAATRFYSGDAVYAKDVTLDAAQLGKGAVWLDFGEGTPVEADPRIASGMRALLESPVREAAIVIVNGKRAGAIWKPPYRLDVHEYLHAGVNHIEIRVDNTAINTLAGRAKPDYRALNTRYGERFVPQNMDHLQALPSGILGGVVLRGEAR